MKALYAILFLFGIVMHTHAQTKTWIGPINGIWSNVNNWSPMGVPNTEDVLIPSGSVVNVDGTAVADTLTVQSGATLNKLTDNSLVMTRGVFETGSVLNISEGRIAGGDVVFNGTLNSIGPLVKGIHNTLIEINNSMNIEAGSGPFQLRSNILRINPSGTLNLQGDGTIELEAFSATLDNQGLIQKAGSTGDFVIAVFFENNGGTIDISSGNFILTTTSTLTDGVYTVSSGSSIVNATTTFVNGTLTGLLNGPLVFQGSTSPPAGGTATFDFTGVAHVEWAGGTLSGGDLINLSRITITGTADLPNALFGGNLLLNNGVIDLVSKESFEIFTGCVVHNSALGVVNLLDSNTVSGGGTLLNEGLISKAASGKNASLSPASLENEAGTIEVLGDTLNFAYYVILSGTDGIYNVAAGAALAHDGSWDIQGVSSGQLDGPLMLTGGGYSLPATDTAVFNFTGNAQVDWYNGTISGGNLKNLSTINSKSTTGFANQVNSSHIRNEGLINVNGLHGIYMYAPSTLLNTTTGVIDMQVDNFIECGAGVTNLGLFKKTGGTGVSAINGSFFHNDPGLVHVEVGTLDFSLLEPGDGDFAGAGTLDLSSAFNTYVVEGDVAPGNSPGTLSIIGGYASSPTAMLNVELNGNTPGIDFDVLAIEDDAIMKGGINLTMGYAAALGDQFEIITATSVDSCFLPATVSAIYAGDQYTFDVICNANNVTLGVISVGVEELIGDSPFSVYPNPATNSTTINFTRALNNLDKPTLTLYNSTGQAVQHWVVGQASKTKQITFDDLPSGVYFLQLTSTNTVSKGTRLVVE